jgi:hypothetical protein
MRLTFSETMRGTLRQSGVDRRVEFTVTARAEGLGFFALEGTGRAEGFAEGPVRGSLHIKLLGLERFIRYRVELPQGFVLEGEKTPSPLRPLRSMTWMPVRLRDAAGATLAEGEMTFALKELPAFVLSALPVGR